jgi:hypothetical protein
MKTEFYVGQPIDDVLRIAIATRRRRRKVEFNGEEGTFTMGEGQPPPPGYKFDLRQDMIVKYFYDDYILTFERSHGPDGTGALCYRVIEVSDV